MDQIFGLTLSMILITRLLAWKSPMILFGAQYMLGSVFRSNSDTYLINFSWFTMLLLVAWAMKRNQVDMDSFRLAVGNISALRKGVLLAGFLLIMLFWLQQANVTSLASMKRTSTSSDLANVANGLLNLFLSPAYAVLLFHRRGNPKWILRLSILVFAVFAFKGFLGSNRGAVLLPLLLVLYARFVQIKRWREVPKFASILGVLTIAGLAFIADVTAQRAGSSASVGIGMFADQLGGELGNGYSPLKDSAVLNYTAIIGPILSPVLILAPLYGFIPRFIWAGKPDVGVGRIIGGDVFGTGGGSYDKGAGIPISVPAEFEAIFGFGGYALGLVFVGLLVALIGILARRRPALVVPLALIAPSVMGSDLGRLGMQFIIFTVSFLIMQRVLKLRLYHVRHVPPRVRTDQTIQLPENV
ncbi:hypothetical protein [Thioclava sp. JE_KL1]|uniref:hypothetical protein n=1 Tax=Thioclava sp. JE_KL1 TaxID=2651187 RepID=UPI00128BF89C|nr:hypothetical protein [Thioclava sp. JE_KL1]MPQ95250.1 hypothetical protein [Thioclava sp. JE_KL1]